MSIGYAAMRPVFLLLVLAATAVSGVRSDVVADFAWKNPFVADGRPPAGFETACEATGTFYARQHNLRDHMTPPPKGFMPWADALKPLFGGRPSPGAGRATTPTAACATSSSWTTRTCQSWSRTGSSATLPVPACLASTRSRPRPRPGKQ